MTTYAGKNSIIFGGCSGIGLATAQLLAQRGSTVTVASQEPSVPESVRSTSGLHWVHCDVRESAQVEEAIDKAGVHGPIDWLVYSAGIRVYGSVVPCTAKQWDPIGRAHV